jgi:diguanylate cyclase (GGDEF)-like protein
MSIKNKVFIYIVVFFATISISDYLVQRTVIYPSFMRIEYNQTADNIRRVLRAIDREGYHVYEVCDDWAKWNDTYEFIDNASQNYIDSNLLYESFNNIQVNLIYYYRNDGTLAWGKVYDLEKGSMLTVNFLKNGKPEQLFSIIFSNSSDEKENGKARSSVINTTQGPMIFATRPILKSDGAGPSKGMLVMGSFITQSMIESLRDQTRLDFEMEYPITEEKIRHIKETKTAHIEPDVTFYTFNQEQFTDVRTLYSDILGEPIFSVFYRFPRDITRQGLASMWYAQILFIISGLIISFLVLVMLQLRLFHPLRRLTNHASRLQIEGDYSIRLNLNRKDEIGTLAESFDIMMQTICERTDDLKTANEKLEQLSRLDGLTGIANRRMFDEVMEKEWRKMVRGKSPLGLILMDVDFFKRYNDLYGHQAGDKCLVEVADAISKNIRRPADLAARYGGEEFVVILPNTDSEGAFFIAEKIRKTIMDLNIKHGVSDVSEFITLSLGVGTVIPQHGDDLNQFIKEVDQALYYSKQTGRNRTSATSEMPSV